MRIVTLVENTANDARLQPEHGLSLYIEACGSKILFDMGQSDAFARNAQVLGIDLSQVDFAVVSHGHYDHGGGLETFLKINSKAPVYIHKLAFGEHYNGAKYIGLNPELQLESRLIFTDDEVFPMPGVKLTDCRLQGWNFSSWGLCRREQGKLCDDPFLHEHYLLIAEGEKQILISGCSHKGIVNIAEYFKPDVLIGGFHLNKLEDFDQLCKIGEKLKKTGRMYYTGHCTGAGQFAALKIVMDNQLKKIETGMIIEI